MRFLAALVALTAFASSALSQGHQPNVIYLMADELAYYELSHMGNFRIKTPNVDRFASEGIRFTKALAAIKPRAAGEKGRGRGDGEEGGRGGKGKARGGKGGGEASDCFKLVQLVVSKGYDPLIVFAFGKTKCMTLANQMATLHLNRLVL